MDTVKDEIAKNLVFFRKKNKMTQKDLAQKLDVRNNTISQWENGTNSIDIDTLFKLCNIFNIPISEMYGRYSNSSNDEYLPEEKNIINSFRNLNQSGKDYILKQINFALSQDDYKKNYNIKDDHCCA